MKEIYNINNLEEKSENNCQSLFDILSAYANIINTTIGGGILGLPTVFYICGAGMGIILSIIFFLLVLYSYNSLIIPASEISEKDNISNQYIATKFVSSSFSNILQIMIILYCIGCCIVYTNVLSTGISSNIKEITNLEFLSNRFFICGILYIFILIPSCLSRNIKWLSIPSWLCLLCILWVLIVLIVQFITLLSNNEINFETFKFFKFDNIFNIFLIAPTIMFAYISQFNVLSIYKGMNNKNSTRMILISFFSKLTCFMLYTLVGLIGYMIFSHLPKMEGNILNNFSKNNNWILSAKISVYIVLIVSYPINMFGATEGTMKLCKLEKYFFYLIILFSFCLITFLLGNAIDDLIILINLCVTFCGGFGCFVFPIIIYYYYLKENSDQKKLNNLKRYFAIIISIILTIMSTISFIIGIISAVKYFKK